MPLVRTIHFAILIALALTGCNLPFSSGPATPVPETATTIPPQAPLQNRLIPVNLPAERSSHAGDYDSSKSSANREAAGGDRFTFAEYERPFNANSMDVYFPELDIIDTLVHMDDLWIYGTITLQGRDPQDRLPGNYAMELDLDRDGRGDWLVRVSDPHSREWSTEGVQVWQDTNKDVGGSIPAYADEDPPSSDGFDRMAFSDGEGADPDAAWARISPADPNAVELAVKRTLLGDTERYLIGMWSGTDLDPGRYDFNDHMTHTEAGAAIRGYEVYYPIKGLAEIDASCRMAVGFAPSGVEPGLCPFLNPDRSGEEGCKLSDATCSAMGPGYYFDAPSCSCKYFG